MPKLFLPLLAVVAIGGATAGGGVYLASRGETVEEVPRPAADLQTTPTATPTTQPEQPPVKGQLWRWVNVTVVIPEGSDVYANEEHVPTDIKPPDGGSGLRIIRDTNPSDNSSSSVLIDAETGAILQRDVQPADRAAIDEVLASLNVAPLDRATAAWPYNGDAPLDLPREQFANFSFIRLPHDTGLDVYSAINDPGGAGIGIKNGRSVATVYLDDAGKLATDTSAVLPQDMAVFQRWLATVKLCGAEVRC